MISPNILVPNWEAESSHLPLPNVQDNTSNEIWTDDGYDNAFSMIDDTDICENHGKIFF